MTVVDDLSTGRAGNLTAARRRGISFHELDIREAGPLREAFAGARPDIVFHLAAQIDVRKSIEDPAWDASINVGGTINVLEAARSTGVGRVVNTSTGGAIYGEDVGCRRPRARRRSRWPPTARASSAPRRYCGWYERLYGLSAVTLRYGNVYGPRQDPAGEAGVIAIFCGRLIGGGTATIFGDGRQTRDYTYVGDIVAANLAAASHPEAHGVYNVGTGTEASVIEVVSALREAAGLGEDEFQPEFAPARLGELQRSSLDVSRARAELGFQTEVELREGMRRTLDWSRSAAAA